MILDISEKSKNINMTPLSFLCMLPATKVVCYIGAIVEFTILLRFAFYKWLELYLSKVLSLFKSEKAKLS